MKLTMQYLPLWTREEITGGLLVVRGRHLDTLTLNHYPETTGGLKKTHKTNNHNHEYHRNPLIVVYCGDLPGMLLWLKGG
jgi:hypothetical protein